MRRKIIARVWIAILCLAFSVPGYGRLRLPRLVSDNMVIQRGDSTRLWGWASPSEKVTISFIGREYNAVAGTDGRWQVIMPLKDAGGPFDMTITGGDTIILHNILVGDVWVGSGQSNMELTMQRVRLLYEKDIAACTNPYIRCFTVPQQYNFNRPLNDFAYGSWVETNPETITDYSAAAYFFALDLYDKYKIPIGIINSSLGGSPAEAWISEKSLKAFPDYYSEAIRFRDTSLIISIDKHDSDISSEWYRELNRRDEGYRDARHKWSSAGLDFSGWKTTVIPGLWDDKGPGTGNGVVWLARRINVPQTMVNGPAKLNLSRIVDADSVFINGIFIGTTGYQYPPRWYAVPAGVLHQGPNDIVIRVISNSGTGGFVPDKKYNLSCNNDTIDLTGTWFFKRGAVMDPLPSQTFIRWKPLGLYNAMIAPLTGFNIKGVIWYQGESNVSRYGEYTKLMSTLISDWRTNWHEGSFPFLIVQLTNFLEAQPEPAESDWALLREAQADLLKVPNTGLAVTIDIGEWNDIHPLDKKDVGKRLALVAEHMAYGDNNVVFSGPVYKSMKINGRTIEVSFTDTGTGLAVKGKGAPACFAIAGADKKFVWAEAKIKGDRVMLSSNRVKHPLYVRYAWADNPGKVNLYNSEGLPAVPFRTDRGGEDKR